MKAPSHVRPVALGNWLEVKLIVVPVVKKSFHQCAKMWKIFKAWLTQQDVAYLFQSSLDHSSWWIICIFLTGWWKMRIDSYDLLRLFFELKEIFLLVWLVNWIKAILWGSRNNQLGTEIGNWGTNWGFCSEFGFWRDGRFL